MKSFAIQSEKSEFDGVWVNDHMIATSTRNVGWFKSVFAENQPRYEAVTLISAIASATSRIRLGALAFDFSLRHPAVLAKMMSSLDFISNGRLEFGICAGWSEEEHTKLGIPFSNSGVRVLKLDEAIQVIKKLWTEDSDDFNGKYYSLSSATCNPKPVQKPHPPISIPAEKRRMMELAAKHADGWDILTVDPDSYKKRSRDFERVCRHMGRDAGEIRRNYLTDLILGKNEQECDRLIRLRARSRGQSAETYKKRMKKFGIVGTPRECVKRIKSYEGAGVQYMILMFPEMENLENIELFADEVAPDFK
jgi:alkanesulfonate monooxygenase SsuD/methylene tetrahydromethanopterin reductase-like flavin-dependent oxidoreductase (luciferase family)